MHHLTIIIVYNEKKIILTKKIAGLYSPQYFFRITRLRKTSDFRWQPPNDGG